MFRIDGKIAKSLKLLELVDTLFRASWINRTILMCNSTLWPLHSWIRLQMNKYIQTQYSRSLLSYFDLNSLALDKVLLWYVSFIGEWPHILIPCHLEIMCLSIVTVISKRITIIKFPKKSFCATFQVSKTPQDVKIAWKLTKIENFEHPAL